MYRGSKKAKEAEARWRDKNRQYLRDCARRRYWEKKVEINARQHDKNWKLKLEVIKAYGGSCTCCGCTTPQFLTIDHPNGRGDRSSPVDKYSGTSLYSALKTLGFPAGYRLHCWNCNAAREFFGVCPHELERQQLVSNQLTVNANSKEVMIQ